MVRPKTNIIDDSRYRPNVGIMMINYHNKIFIGKRIKSQQNGWQMPQGGIDENEDPYNAALREMLEEIGTNDVTLIAQLDDWLYYNIPKVYRSKNQFPNLIGQKQKWFLFRFEGEDDEINIQTADPEFSSWKWVDPNSILENVINFRHEVYKAVLTYFQNYIA